MKELAVHSSTWSTHTASQLLVLATAAAALGCGLMAGLLFAFSTFVMQALARIPDAEGIRAMQSINVAIVTPAFLFVFMGTALVSLFLALAGAASSVSPTARYLLWSGSLLYLLGVIGVTALFNIPLNDTLAHMGADSIEASAFWHRYLAAWTIWNHVRAAAALAGTAAFLFASMALTRCGL